MKLWLFSSIAALYALSACSGPPDFRPPDRPASFAGEIGAVEAYDLETGVLEVRVPGPANHVASVRHVAVTPGTLLLMTGSTYPAAFNQFVTGRHVQVWVGEDVAAEVGLAHAECIQLDLAVAPSTQ